MALAIATTFAALLPTESAYAKRGRSSRNSHSAPSPSTQRSASNPPLHGRGAADHRRNLEKHSERGLLKNKQQRIHPLSVAVRAGQEDGALGNCLGPKHDGAERAFV
jgi:hypothetical protein